MPPKNRLYSKKHIWVKQEKEIAILGLTDFAQTKLGDIIYIDLPEIGTLLSKGYVFSALEGLGINLNTRYYYELQAPISGEVIDINENVYDNPDLINSNPYTSGWLIKVMIYDAQELSKLIDAQNYETYISKLQSLQGRIKIIY